MADAAHMLREYGSTECTAQFWMSETPARQFSTLRECLDYLSERGRQEPLPDVHVHAPDGDIAINGPELEILIRCAESASGPRSP